MIGNKEVDTTFNSRMNYIFGPLEKNRVPYGLLRDYAFEFTNLDGYNGTTIADSNIVTPLFWREIYNSLVTSRVTAAAYTTLPDPKNVDSLWFNARAPEQITIAGLFYKYSYFKNDAITTNKLTLTNEKLYDRYINGVWQNPYNEAMVVAFAPSTEQYVGKKFKIAFPSTLWVTNSNSSVNHIEVDIQDGQGFQTIPVNGLLQVNYASSGLKIWTFKVILNDHRITKKASVGISADAFLS